jgi:hypothetical protein
MTTQCNAEGGDRDQKTVRLEFYLAFLNLQSLESFIAIGYGRGV